MSYTQLAFHNLIAIFGEERNKQHAYILCEKNLPNTASLAPCVVVSRVLVLVLLRLVVLLLLRVLVLLLLLRVFVLLCE